MNKLTDIALFAGAGGFPLAAKLEGFTTTVINELEPFFEQDLKDNFPKAEVFIQDIREFTPPRYEYTVLSGGFPCQDISLAAARYKQEGIHGKRSSLWFDMLRCIREARPQYVIVENVAALRLRGLGDVATGLADCGYVVEWYPIQASDAYDASARKRLMVVAHSHGKRCQVPPFWNRRVIAAIQEEMPVPQVWAEAKRTGSRGAWYPTLTQYGDVDAGIPRWLAEAQIKAAGNSVSVKTARIVYRLIRCHMALLDGIPESKVVWHTWDDGMQNW